MVETIGYQMIRRYATWTTHQMTALQSVIDTTYLVAYGFNRGRIERQNVQFVIHTPKENIIVQIEKCIANKLRPAVLILIVNK